jgi:hypothetical protein
MSATPLDRPASAASMIPAAFLKWLAILLALVALGAVAALLLLQGEAGFGFELNLSSIGFLGIIILSPIVGAAVIQRRPSTRVAWLLILIGVSLGLGFGLSAYGLAGAGPAGSPRHPELPLAIEVLALSGLLFIPALGVATTFILLLFPTDRLLTPRWRLVAGMVVAGAAVYELAAIIRPGDLDPDGRWRLQNPFGAPASVGPAIQLALQISTLTLLIGFVLGVVSLVLRYRRAGPVEAAQIRWLAAVAVLAVPVLVVSGFDQLGPISTLADQLGVVFLACMPVAIGIAITRYRLYDIDRLINRAIVYGSLTAILAGVFAAAAAVSQRIFLVMTGGTSDAAIVITTLIVATLYTPLRKRIDTVVDRRFKYEQSRFGSYREQLDQALSLVDDEVAAERLAREIATELGVPDVAVLDSHGQRVASVGHWPIAEPVTIEVSGGRGAIRTIALSRGSRRRHALNERRLAEVAAIATLAARVVRRPEGR